MFGGQFHPLLVAATCCSASPRWKSVAIRRSGGKWLSMLGRTSNPVSRLQQLAPERRRLLMRACILLTVASAAVAALPFRWAIRLGPVPLGGQRRLSVEDAVWAVQAAARQLPWRTVCIEKGIALQRMLRSSGFDAVLHYGARHHDVTGALEAHVWVTLDGTAVIGGEEAANFAELARYR